MQQGSIESLSGDPHTEDRKTADDGIGVPEEASTKMESEFKILMQATGATSPKEVMDRFLAQKEATSRLNYLRTVTEGEKKHLETERDRLLGQLETFKFSDIKENEVCVLIRIQGKEITMVPLQKSRAR